MLAAGVTGCAGLSEKQYPAPVYSGHGPATVYRQSPTPAPMRPPVQMPEPTVKTAPIPEFNQQVIPIVPTPATSLPITGVPDDAGALLPDAGEAIAADAIPTPVTPSPAFTAPAPETFTPAPFQPIEPSASTSPAVGALVMSANQNTQAGNLDSAIATIERARNIEPSNAGLYYKLALLRLKQSKPKLAEELAKKAAHLAAGDRHLKKHSWLLIAHAREMQKDFKGAKAARDKADSF